MATTTPDSGPAPQASHKKRPTPERTAPHRQMTALRRRPAAKTAAASGAPAATGANGPANAPGRAAAAPADETAESRAVRTGYELAEAAIRRGQEAAKRLAPSDAGSVTARDLPGAKEALGMAEGALRAWAELATAWFRAVLPLAPDMIPDPTRVLSTLRDAMSGQASSGRAPVSGQALSSAPFVLSARPARVALELSRQVEPAALAVQPLQQVEGEGAKQASLAAELRAGKDGRSVEVHLAPKASQPEGRYLGAVYEKTTGAFVGGLTVELT